MQSYLQTLRQRKILASSISVHKCNTKNTNTISKHCLRKLIGLKTSSKITNLIKRAARITIYMALIRPIFLMTTSLYNQAYISFHIMYNIIYHISFHQKLGPIYSNACLAITGFAKN